MTFTLFYEVTYTNRGKLLTFSLKPTKIIAIRASTWGCTEGEGIFLYQVLCQTYLVNKFLHFNQEC